MNKLDSFLEVSPNFRKFIEDNECYVNWEDYYGDDEEKDKIAFYQYLKKHLDKEYYFCSYNDSFGTRMGIGSKEEIEKKYNYIKIENNTMIIFNLDLFDLFCKDRYAAVAYNIKEDKELKVNYK